MSDIQEEINEILDKLYLNFEKAGLTVPEYSDLRNYITNLQEENEYNNYCNKELRKKITNLEYKIERLEEQFDLVCKISEERKNKWLNLNDKNEDLFNIIKDYKLRNEKVIEFCKYSLNNPWYSSEKELLGAILKKAQGVDKE